MTNIQRETPERSRKLLVYESGRRWADALRQPMRSLGVEVRHASAAADVVGWLSKDGDNNVLVELGPQPLASLELIERIGRIRSETVVIAIAKSNQRDLEAAARELGVAVFLSEPLTARELTHALQAITRAQSAWPNRFDAFARQA